MVTATISCNDSNYQLAKNKVEGAIGTIRARRLALALREDKLVKEYDGNAAIQLGEAAFSLTGELVQGDDVKLEYPAEGVYDNANAGLNKTVTATGAQLNGAGASNYTLETDSYTSAKGEISPKTLEIVLTGKVEKVYDGTKVLTLVPDDITLQGKIENTVLGVKAVEGEFVSSDAAEQVGVSLKTLELDGADKGNYSVELSKLNFSGRISPKKIAVTIADATIKAGEALPTFTYKVEPALCAGDALVGEPECEALKGESGSEIRAGEYVIGEGTIAVGTGKASNHSIAVAEGKLTVESQPGVEKPTAVDGEAVADLRVVPNPTQGYCRVEGLQESQTVYVFNMQGAMVGSYRVNRQGLLNLSHEPAGTYILRVGRTSLRLLKR